MFKVIYLNILILASLISSSNALLNEPFRQCISSLSLSLSIQISPNHFHDAYRHSSSSNTNSIILSKSNDDSSIFRSYIKDDFVRGLVSGAASRASKEILLHPFDTIRARQQVKKNNLFNSTSFLTKQEHKIKENKGLFVDLYAGLAPALIGGIPAGAVFFAVKDSFKSYAKSINIGSTLPFLASKESITILSVIVANIFYWVIRSPAEELKTKQQIGQNTTEFATLNYVLDVFKTNGPQGVIQQLYGSYLSNIIYALPADILKFLACKYYLLKKPLTIY